MHNPPRKIFIVLLLISIVVGYLETYSVQNPFHTFFRGLEGPFEEERFHGYVEGEFLSLALPVAGTLTHLFVQQGDWVKKGDKLFILEPEPETFTVHEAEQWLKAAQARLEDLNKGQRPSEIKAIRARLNQVEVDLELAKIEQTRYEALFRQKMVQQEVLDAARATTKRNEARIAEIEAQWHTARSIAREDLIGAAKAEVLAAQAVLEKSRWGLAKKQQHAPQVGQVIETFYYEGEWVPTGNPVLSLLPPEQIKVRFFVSEQQLGQITLGQNVCLVCDGCDQRILATVNYISPQAEYTPPVIYSQENRAKLVYMIEAKPVIFNKKLHPGQPIEVRLSVDQMCH